MQNQQENVLHNGKLFFIASKFAAGGSKGVEEVEQSMVK